MNVVLPFDESTARDELLEFFGEAVGKDHEDVMAECLSICRLYSLPAAELFYKNEALILSRSGASSSSKKKLSLTLDDAKELRRIVQQEFMARQQKQQVGGGTLAAGGSAAAGPGGSASTPVNGSGGSGRKPMMGGGAGGLGDFLDTLATPSRLPGGASGSGAAAAAAAAGSSIRAGRPPPSTVRPSVPARLSAADGNNAYSTPTKASTMGSSGLGANYGASPGITGSSIKREPLGSSPYRNGNTTMMDGVSMETPTNLSSMRGPAIPFADRKTPFELLESLNAHLPASGREGDGGVPHGTVKQRVKLATEIPPEEAEYRYMFEKTTERSTTLDGNIDDFAERMQDAYGVAEIGDPSALSTDSVFVVGRIISAATDSGKPTEGSLSLETSRALGDGKRTPLRFSPNVKVRGNAPGARGFGLFPGALMAFMGRNGGGGVFQVEEVLLPPPSDMLRSPASDLIRYQHRLLAGKAASLIVAAGPFTLDTNLDYEPLEALMEVVRADRPDLLVLLGPFVDSSHPLIKAGDIDETPRQIFINQISRRLNDLAEECPAMGILLFPSVRDMVSRHVAFPQAALAKDELALPKRARVLPSPCSLYVNEINICLSTVDVLFHLRREEYFRRAEEAEPSDPKAQRDGMAELCRHVLGQKSYYPIFPCPEEYSSDVNLDVTHYNLLRLASNAPDILILPSKLKHFAKIVDSIVAVNPSSLSKASSPGTFCKITIQPLSQGELKRQEESGEEVEHKLYERTRVDVVRI